MNGKITYHQQVSYCGKPRCRKCREGTGHGPYWYSYQTVGGKTVRTYIGKQLPAEALATIEGVQETTILARQHEPIVLRIYTFGQFRLERRVGLEWQTVTDPAWQHQRTRAILCSLISNPAHKLAREQIMDLLWPDLEAEVAVSRLDRAVHSLRHVFEPSRERLASSPLLLTERESLVLADQNLIWIDCDNFEHLLAQARASNDPGEIEQLLDEAVTLYGGEFLPEERSMEMTLMRRDALRRSWIGALLELADLRIAREALSGALSLLDRLLATDPANEAGVQRMMSLLAQMGRRGEAMRIYKRLASVLQQEYNVAPLPETRAIYDAIRQGSDKLNGTHKIKFTNSDRLRGQDEGSQRPPLSSDSPAIQIGRSHQSQLVGREQELAVLQSLVSTTEHAAKFRLPGQRRTTLLPLDTQRRPQSMLLMGEVGIGKTRLAEEIGRDVRRHGWAVAWSRVYTQESNIPYRLWTEILRKAMSQGTWSRQEISKRPLVYQPLCLLLPELQDLMPQVAFSSPLPPEQEQLRIWEAARELLVTISGGSPLLIVLDDLQWSDGSSCELLAYLARRVHGHPIVIVGTCRENELAPQHPLRALLTDLQREHAVETMELQPLSDEQIATLVSQLLSDLATSNISIEPIVQHIKARAAGNPFFAEELARISPVIQNGVAVPVASVHDSIGVPRPLITTLPDTINAVLELRLGHLSSACQRLLSKAAVLNGPFEFPIIREMDANTPGSSEDTVLELLEEALKAGMITEEGTGTLVAYQFWHPLLMNHLYEKLSAGRRANLHRRAADILRSVYLYNEEEGAATIVYHLLRGGASAETIVHYAELAGKRAYSLSVYPDAEYYYQLTLEHLAAHEKERPHRAYLLECLGECTSVQGKDETGRSYYEQALELRKRHYALQSTSDARHEAQIQAMLLCEIGQTWYSMGNNVQARSYIEQAEQVLRAVDILDGTVWGRLRLLRSYTYWREGAYEEARRLALESLTLFQHAIEARMPESEELHRIRRTIAGDPVDIGRTYILLGLITTGTGQSQETITFWKRALTLFEQHERRREIAIVCCDLGDAYLRKADYAQAQEVLRRSLNIAEQIGEIPLVSFVFGNMGISSLRLANLKNAESEFKRAITLAEIIRDKMSLSLWHSYLANAMQEQNELLQTENSLISALTNSRTMHITPYIGLSLVAVGNMRIIQAITNTSSTDTSTLQYNTKAHLLKRAIKTLRHALNLSGIEAETRTEGRLSLAYAEFLAGHLDTAYQLAEQALDEARQYELLWLIARAQRVLCVVLVAQGNLEAARMYFQEARGIFKARGMLLEYARTLHHYALALLQHEPGAQEHLQAIDYLYEAQDIFAECRAQLDEQLVRQELARLQQIKR